MYKRQKNGNKLLSARRELDVLTKDSIERRSGENKVSTSSSTFKFNTLQTVVSSTATSRDESRDFTLRIYFAQDKRHSR